ncbi:MULTISPECIES: hypothetical protein [unclassified Wenzhouxiangella]|nr:MULTISPECIES: hypothetical protein [unclassified Wenzhouxiangella]
MGQLIGLALLITLAVLAVRFLLSATRLMNRKADALEREARPDRGNGSR